RDRGGRGVVRVAAHPRLETAAKRRLLLLGEIRVARGAGLALGPGVEHCGGLAMQPIRAPVRRDVAAVAPDRPELQAAEGLPYLSPALDFARREDHAAVGRDDPLRDGRRLPIDLAADQ